MNSFNHTFIRLFFISILLAFMSCEQEELGLAEEQASGQIKMLSSATGVTVEIDPSGDQTGNTDVDVIENAFRIPGIKIVKLKRGTYYINRSIVVPVGFSGTFKGAGRQASIIEGVGSATNPFPVGDIYVPMEPALVRASSLIFFPNPDQILRISDMGLTISNGFEAEVSDFDGTNNLTVFVSMGLETAGSSISMRNLNLTGTDATLGSPNWYVSQPLFGALVLGDRNGANYPQPSISTDKIDVQQCEISKTAYQALIIENMKDANVRVDNNRFTETKQVNIRFLDGCLVQVTDNFFDTNSWGSLVITQEFALGMGAISGSPNRVRILENKINSNGFLGIEVGAIPFPNSADFNITIAENLITKGNAPLGGPNVAGIGIYEGHAGVKIIENQLQGNANYGILLLDTDNCTISDNSHSGLNSSIADYGLTGPSDNNSVNVETPATAIDEGTNNQFIGPVTIL